MNFRKKPIVIEAVQWFKLGDHPSVFAYTTNSDLGRCGQCRQKVEAHGWVDTLEGGHIVCPSDWIITGVQGEVYPCKNDIFEQTYEKAE